MWSGNCWSEDLFDLCKALGGMLKKDCVPVLHTDLLNSHKLVEESLWDFLFQYTGENIYSFKRHHLEGRERERERGKRSLVHWFIFQMSTPNFHRGLGWAKARSQKRYLGFPHGWQKFKYLSHLLPPRECSSKELDWKWNWDLHLDILTWEAAIPIACCSTELTPGGSVT